MIPICPKCDAQLLNLRFKEVEVDFCERCRGLWLDAGELEALMRQTGGSADDPLMAFQNQPGATPSRERKHLCPRCDQTLREVAVPRPGAGPLHLDRCPRGHGLWFDASELRQLLALFPPASGATHTIAFLNEFLGPINAT
ncbi:MAG: zf-TFIIB domain-containing protein [Verrucomicrobia bacterium]|nr:zf-TFIIB domain-containing protein [Verrucomicrobiota bacterium]